MDLTYERDHASVDEVIYCMHRSDSTIQEFISNDIQNVCKCVLIETCGSFIREKRGLYI